MITPPNQSNGRPSEAGDIGFIRPRPRYPDGILARVLLQERLLLAIPANYKLDGTDNLASLAHEAFIVPQFDEHAGFSEYATDFSSKVGLTPERFYCVRDFLTAISLVAGGFGIALVPESLRCLSMANVMYKQIEHYDRLVGLAIAYRADESEPAVRAFIEVSLKVGRCRRDGERRWAADPRQSPDAEI